MRIFKHLGLAALLVLALAAIGSSAASADRLCVDATAVSDPCATGDIVPSGTAVSGQLRTGTSARLVTSGGLINPTITCTASTVSVTSSSAGGASGTRVTGGVAIGGVTFTGCTSTSPSGCSATITNTNATTGSLSWASGLNGTLSLTAPNFPVTCPPGINCVFGGNVVSAPTATGTIGTAAGAATITFSGVTINQTAGGSCPRTASWTATYVVTRIGSATSGVVGVTRS